MRTVEVWAWRVPDDIKPKKTYVTRWKMTEAEALARWPTAERVGAPEVRTVLETDEERLSATTTGASSYGEWGAAPGTKPCRPTSATPSEAPAPCDGTPPLPSP